VRILLGDAVKGGWRVCFCFLASLCLAVGAEPETSKQEKALTPPPPVQPASPYRFEVDDEISIKVFQQPELDTVVRVSPDGTISVVLLSETRVVGLTADELKAKLVSAFGKYIRDPQVSVSVRNFANRKIFVGGEVERPGLMPLVGGMNALGAVLMAGGFKSTARTDSVVLIRNAGNNQPIASRLNLKDVLQKGKPDIALQSFDVVYVPMSKIAKVDRFVDQYIRQAIPANLNAGFTYLLGNNSVIRFQ